MITFKQFLAEQKAWEVQVQVRFKESSALHKMSNDPKILAKLEKRAKGPEQIAKDVFKDYDMTFVKWYSDGEDFVAIGGFQSDKAEEINKLQQDLEDDKRTAGVKDIHIARAPLTRKR